MYYYKNLDIGKLGPQQLKYPASIPPKPRPIKKHTSLTPQFKKKVPRGFYKKHPSPHLVLQIFLSHTL
jgi:hypothetical protein